MIVIKGKEETITLKITFSKTYLFSKEVCPKDESLLSVIPNKVMANDGLEFLVKLVKHYQVDTKFDEVQVAKILDEYFEEPENDMFVLYTSILKEYDYAGVFKKGLGKQMAESLEKAMNQVGEQMTKTVNSLTENAPKNGSKN